MDKQKLADVGIDYLEGVNRFTGNKGLYEQYLKSFFDCNELGHLKTDMEDGNMSHAFRTAYILMGETGNLSINSLYGKISGLTEILCKKEMTDTEKYEIKRIMIDIDSAYEDAKQAVCDI